LNLLKRNYYENRNRKKVADIANQMESESNTIKVADTAQWYLTMKMIDCLVDVGLHNALAQKIVAQIPIDVKIVLTDDIKVSFDSLAKSFAKIIKQFSWVCYSFSY